MTEADLTQRCLMLTDNQKIKLITKLKKSMGEEPENDGSRFSVLFRAATELCGKGILTNFRMRELVIGRMMIAYQMRLDGYAFKTIGKHLVRNYSSIIYLHKTMQEVLDFPHIYKKEKEYWTKFQNLIREYEKKI